MNKTSIKNTLNLLNLYKESGVDELISSRPKNRTVRKKDHVSKKMQKSDEMNSAKVSEEINLEGINTLEELKNKMSTFQGCQLYKSATNMVFSDGNPKSKIMLIGEAPGHDEDLQAKPFVGRSGKLLDKMLEAIDLNREKVYIANIIPWRPPANRRPTEDEINSCLPFILKHIEIIKPSALMLLGSTATFAILRNKEGISKIRGKWVDLKINQMTIPTMPTFHPAFLLRQPGQKKHVWTDLQSLRDKIKQK
jgi:uracil-DNA glycosylase family 4